MLRRSSGLASIPTGSDGALESLLMDLINARWLGWLQQQISLPDGRVESLHPVTVLSDGPFIQRSRLGSTTDVWLKPEPASR